METRPMLEGLLGGLLVLGLLGAAGGCTGSADGGPGASTAPSTAPATAPATGTGTRAASGPESSPESSPAPLRTNAEGLPFDLTPVAQLSQPWAMTFLPDGRALVTQRTGELVIVDPATGATTKVAGTPTVVAEGQGSLGDVVLGPTFPTDAVVYLSWVEAGSGGTGAVLGRARLVPGAAPRLDGLRVIWRQTPKVSGSGHFGHRLAFSPDGRYLFVTSGERQKFAPAQDAASSLGKIIRMAPDGSGAQIWTSGHRNPLGLAFDESGRLWSSEMGPRGGDELNLIERGANYGWPTVSNGSHYSGEDIPDHAAGDGFEAPKVWWNPSISPSSLMIYTGSAFAPWRGDAFLGALSGLALIRVDLDGQNARKGDQWDLGQRIREVEQGPDGSLWLLEDGGGQGGGGGGRLMHLTPVR